MQPPLGSREVGRCRQMQAEVGRSRQKCASNSMASSDQLSYVSRCTLLVGSCWVVAQLLMPPSTRGAVLMTMTHGVWMDGNPRMCSAGLWVQNTTQEVGCSSLSDTAGRHSYFGHLLFWAFLLWENSGCSCMVKPTHKFVWHRMGCLRLLTQETIAAGVMAGQSISSTPLTHTAVTLTTPPVGNAPLCLVQLLHCLFCLL